MNDLVGRQLGSYKLKRKLGEGGYAEVYLGEHITLKSPFAIKVLREKVTDENDRAEFRREAQTVAQFKHPNIIRVIDFAEDGDTPFLVMDYAPHGTLRKLYPHGTRVPLDTVVAYTQQIASALQYAHTTHYIHRDVKPENILIGDNREAMLGDFGIVVVAHRTASQVMEKKVGTYYYMSPEQFQGYPHIASDQYALAVVVYELLCGEPPFQGNDYLQLAYQHSKVAVPSLRKKNSAISSLVEQVVLKALSKDRKQRYRSVQAFANALEAASKAKVGAFRQTYETTPRVWSIAFPQLLAIVLGIVLYGGAQIGINYLGYSFFNQFFATHHPLENLDIASLTIWATSLNWITLLVGAAFLFPLFFGAVFGPWVGLLVGGVGSFLGDYLLSLLFPTSQWGQDNFGWGRYLHMSNLTQNSFDWKWYAGNALLGFIAGLILAGTKRDYKGFGTFLAIEIISIIALTFGLSVIDSSNILFSQTFSNLPAALDEIVTLGVPTAVISLIVLPIALLITEAIVNR